MNQDTTFSKASTVAKQNLDVPKPLDVRYSGAKPGDPVAVVNRNFERAVTADWSPGGEVRKERYSR
jgi:hypothetical protein